MLWGRRKKITARIIDQGGDYVINQGKLHKVVKEFFTESDEQHPDSFEFFEHEEKSHDRLTTRRYSTSDAVEAIPPAIEWKDLSTIGMVETECERNAKVTHEFRYYIGSIANDAESFAKAIRTHQEVENELHQVPDAAFREDGSGMRKGNSAENFAVLRHFALNSLKLEKTAGVGTTHTCSKY